MSCLLFHYNGWRTALRQAVFGVLLVFVNSSRVDAATVAIVPASLDVNAFADVLTVPLSKIPNVTVVDRAEIQRVIREQELALTQPQAVVKVGRLLNADGIVLLEKRLSHEKKELLSLRTVAVKAGVIILQDEFTLPFADVTTWATSYIARIEQILPKLTVRMEDAVAISVGSLRSSVSTGDGGSLEQELTALLRLRLAHEPSVFLLERRNMDALQNEKGLAAAEEPFWNGAFIIDGTINRDIVSQSGVTIDARVAAPNVPAIQVRVDGRRESLPDLANKLVTNILARIGRKAAVPAWQAAEEAERFLQEAQWAARWGLWQQARDAADASWALGSRIRLVAGYQIVSRALLALSMRSYLGWEPADAYGFHQPPSPETLPMVASTLEMYEHGSRYFSVGTNRSDSGWLSLGIAILPVTSRVLDQYYRRVEYREGHEDELRRVRALARQVNQLLMTNSAVWSVAWRYDFQGLPVISSHTKSGPVQSLPAAWVDSEGLWFESPRQAVDAYTSILSPLLYGSGRFALLGSQPQSPPPPLAGWSAKDREELVSLWSQFLGLMTASSNAVIRGDGFQLILSHSENPDEIVTAARNFIAIHAEHQLGTQLFPVGLIISNALTRIEAWGVPQVETLRQLRDVAPKHFDIEDPARGYADWKKLLRTFQDPQAEVPLFQAPLAKLPSEQVDELISEFEKIEQQKRPGDRDRRWAAISYCLRVLRAKQSPARKTPAGGVAAQNSTVARNDGGPLVISRLWKSEEQALPPGRFFAYTRALKSIFWQEGRLWIEALTSGDSNFAKQNRIALLSFDLPTLTAQVIESPFESAMPVFGGETIRDSFRASVIVGSDIFMSAPDAIWRRNSSGAWKQFPVPISGIPIAWEKSIVLGGPESIIQLLPETGEVRILASTRRNPPVTALDKHNLNDVILAVWPGNILCAAVEGQIWKFDPARKDWSSFIAATNCGESVQLETQGVFYRQSGECGGPRFFGGWRPGLTIMDYYGWSQPSGWTSSRGSSRRVIEPVTPALWNCPAQSAFYNRVAQFDVEGIWIFPSRYRLTILPRELSPPTLLFLNPSLGDALEMEIDFSGRAKAEATVYKQDPVRFLSTPKGLAILVQKAGTLFWAPKEDVELALAHARRRQNATERLDAGALPRFDSDGDGWLNDAERRVMRHDAAWQKELSARISAASSAALKKLGGEWDNLFVVADKNNDGKLSSLEFVGIATNQVVFGKRLQGINGSPAQVTRPYDLNNDSALDRNEFKEFMADPRLPAEVLRSASWVAKFGLKVEACDTNDDGILDSAERTQTYRLIRQKLGQSGRESN